MIYNSNHVSRQIPCDTMRNHSEVCQRYEGIPLKDDTLPVSITVLTHHVCVYIYIYIRTYIPICKYTYVCVYIYVYIYIQIYTWHRLSHGTCRSVVVWSLMAAFSSRT